MKTNEEQDTWLEFMCSIYELWDEFGFSTTSQFRSVQRNELVGGKPTSKHLDGLAIDVVFDPDVPEDRVQKFLVKVKEKGMRFLDERQTSKPHLHIQAF